MNAKSLSTIFSFSGVSDEDGLSSEGGTKVHRIRPPLPLALSACSPLCRTLVESCSSLGFIIFVNEAEHVEENFTRGSDSLGPDHKTYSDPPSFNESAEEGSTTNSLFHCKLKKNKATKRLGLCVSVGERKPDFLSTRDSSFDAKYFHKFYPQTGLPPAEDSDAEDSCLSQDSSSQMESISLYFRRIILSSGADAVSLYVKSMQWWLRKPQQPRYMLRLNPLGEAPARSSIIPVSILISAKWRGSICLLPMFEEVEHIFSADFSRRCDERVLQLECYKYVEDYLSLDPERKNRRDDENEILNGSAEDQNGEETYIPVKDESFVSFGHLFEEHATLFDTSFDEMVSVHWLFESPVASDTTPVAYRNSSPSASLGRSSDTSGASQPLELESDGDDDSLLTVNITSMTAFTGVTPLFENMPVAADPQHLWNGLTDLDLSYCTNISGWASSFLPTSVQHLGLKNTLITHLRPVSACSSLVTLDIRNCAELTSLAPLSSCSSLVSIHALGCGALTDIGRIGGDNTRLRFLNLGRCESLSSVAGLAGARRLQILNIEGTAIADLSPLAGCYALIEINAIDTLVGDLTSVSRLPRLRTVRANPFISSIGPGAEHNDGGHLGSQNGEVWPALRCLWLCFNPQLFTLDGLCGGTQKLEEIFLDDCSGLSDGEETGSILAACGPQLGLVRLLGCDEDIVSGVTRSLPHLTSHHSNPQVLKIQPLT